MWTDMPDYEILWQYLILFSKQDKLEYGGRGLDKGVVTV